MQNILAALQPLIADMFGAILLAVLLALKVDLGVAVTVSASVAVAVIVAQIARGQPVPALGWISLALVLVLGAAAMMTHDARFVMMKPSVIYAIIGVVMLRRGWMNRYMPVRVRAVVEDVTIRFGYAWAALMLATSLANLVVAILWPAAWARFILLVLPLSKIALFTVHYIVIRRTAMARLKPVAGAQPL